MTSSLLMIGPKTFPPVMGGIETHVFEVSKRLARRGFEVEVAVPRMRGQERSESVEGVKVTRVACVPSRYTVKLSSLPGVVRLIRADRHRTVHAHDATGGFACAEFADRSNFVYTMHGIGFSPRDWPPPFRQGIRMMQRSALRRAGHVFCTDEATASEARRERPDAEVLSSGVDPDEFAKAGKNRPGAYGSSDFVVLFVGRLAPVKGVDTLLSAMELLSQEQRAGMRFVFVGDGPMRADIERAASNNKDISVVGAVPHDRVAPYFAHADAYVLPSRAEGVPISLLEALAAGLPSVASDVGGVRSQMDHSAFVPVNADDPRALADALVRLHGDGRLRKDLGQKGLAFVKKSFSWDRVVDRLVEVYGSLGSASAPAHVGPGLVPEHPGH